MRSDRRPLVLVLIVVLVSVLIVLTLAACAVTQSAQRSARETASWEAATNFAGAGNAATEQAALVTMTAASAEAEEEVRAALAEATRGARATQEAGRRCAERIRQGTELDYSKLKPAARLAGCDLGGLSLYGLDLREADLSFTNLEGTDLHDANLSGATFRGAYLRGTDLSGANLSGTDLTSAILVVEAKPEHTWISFFGDCFAWSPDGARIAWVDAAGGDVMLWDTETGARESVVPGHEGPIIGVSWSHAGIELAYQGTKEGLQLRDMEGTLLTVFDLDLGVADVRAARVYWSPNYARLAFPHADGEWLGLPNLATGEIQLIEGRVSGIAWSPDSAQLATDGTNGFRLWDGETGALLAMLSADPLNQGRLSWSPDGSRLAVAGSDGVLRLWDTERQYVARTLPGPYRGYFDLDWSPDGVRLAAIGRDCVAWLWDTSQGILQGTLDVCERPYSSMSTCRLLWSPDGKRLASYCSDGTIRLWPVAVLVR